MSRRLCSKSTLAAKVGVSTRTITNWHGAGFVTAYRVPGQPGLLYDLDEVQREIAGNASMRVPSKLRGPVAEINGPVVIVPEVVTR